MGSVLAVVTPLLSCIPESGARLWRRGERIYEARWDAPTCAYCHILYVDEE